MASLSARAGHALRWGTLTLLARFGLQLGVQVVLARLLGPAAYGVYALGLAVLTFASFLAGTGFSYSLVLRPFVGPRDIRLAFTWQCAAGLACAWAMATGAPALAAFFREPALVPTLRWLALACAFTAASGTALALMQRELDLRRQGLVQIAAYALGYLGVGLPLALAGWQASALAAACAAQAAATLALALWMRPHPLWPLWRGAGRADTLDVGRTVFFTNLVNWLSANLDRLIIGRCLPTQAVGLYALAWNLSQIPVTLLVGATQPTLMATGTQLVGSRRRLAGAWQLATGGAAVLLPPIALCLALLARDLVAVLYGPAWAPSGALLALMLLCLPAWAAWALATPVLWHRGQARREATLQLPLLALALPLWWWAAREAGSAMAPEAAAGADNGLWASTLPVALVTALLLHARALVTVRAALGCLGLRASDFTPAMLRGAALAAACAMALSAARATAIPFEGSWPPGALAALRLLSGGGAALATGLLLVRWRPSLLGPEALALLRRARPAESRP